MRAAALAAVAVATAAASPPASSFCARDGWTTAWLDDFDGDALDPTSWTAQVGNAGRNIGSCRDAYCDAANVGVANGTLLLTTKREVHGGYNFTTGAVETAGKRHWTPPYRLCASAMLPGGAGPDAAQGIWPALWLSEMGGVARESAQRG